MNLQTEHLGTRGAGGTRYAIDTPHGEPGESFIIPEDLNKAHVECKHDNEHNHS